MKYILGKKVGMTQVFDEAGLLIPVTVLQAGPCTVVQVKTHENDGYSALCIAYEDIKEKKVTKPVLGIYKKAGVSPKKYLREMRTDDIGDFVVGKEFKSEDMFQEGDRIDITGTSKGKGFQGTVKRHGTSRGRETHGSHYHRGPGSMGANSDPSRVFKGKKLPGHMGNKQVTVKNLRVVKADSENNLLIVKGAVPGPKGGLLIIKETTKS